MEGLRNVAFLVVATTKNSLFGLDGNPIVTAQPNSIAAKLDTAPPDAYCNILTYPDTFFGKFGHAPDRLGVVGQRLLPQLAF